MQDTLVARAQEGLAADAVVVLLLHLVGKARADEHVDDRGREHDGVEQDERPNPPAPDDGNEHGEPDEVAQEAVGLDAGGVVGGGDAQRRGEDEQARRDDDHDAEGGRGPDVASREQPHDVSHEHRDAAEKNEQADDAHEDGDHAKHGLGRRAGNRGLEVLHALSPP